jgi:pseudomonalisin
VPTFRPVCCGILLAAVVSAASGPSAAAAGARAVDGMARQGTVPPAARPEFDLGRSNPNLPMERMVLLLALQPGAGARLDQLLTEQHNPASPLYHQWLTPEQFGTEFGLGDDELELVTGWLREQGFTIEEVAAGRGWINFSGAAAQVERAFATEMHDYQLQGAIYHSNAIAPSLPARLLHLVDGIVSLDDFPAVLDSASSPTLSEVAPAVTEISHSLAPADFATIYDLNPAYNAGLDGAGVTIAITAVSDIKLADVQVFRQTFGLPANDPVFIHVGPEPGNTGGKNEREADLDTEWSGAVAPRANIELVISAGTHATRGIELAAQHIVDHNLAPVMSTSFGACEADMNPTLRHFWHNLYAQAVAQGITAFVASFDSGAATCYPSNATKARGVGVNGYCSTPYNVCVGGTQFDDTDNPGAFWAPTNNPVTKASAISYIPEVAWNESGLVAGGSQLWSSGGGISRLYSKPSWQSAPGVPADGKRDVPDVALSAAQHDGYNIFQQGQMMPVRGTSAASPSFAGLMALVVQKTGKRQGNANPVLYQLATQQYSAAGPAVFHDITGGNNSVPGVTGYFCNPGYDLVTGLGSVDGAALIDNWPSP